MSLNLLDLQTTWIYFHNSSHAFSNSKRVDVDDAYEDNKKWTNKMQN